MVNIAHLRDEPLQATTVELLAELHQRGVTYQAIANRLGVNWRTIHRWSKAQTHPTIEALINVALTGILEALRASEEAVEPVENEGKN